MSVFLLLLACRYCSVLYVNVELSVRRIIFDVFQANLVGLISDLLSLTNLGISVSLYIASMIGAVKLTI